MEAAFSSYSLIEKDPGKVLKKVKENGFEGFEILSEGKHDLRNENVVKKFQDIETELEITVHVPISDMNLGCLNKELWEVTVSQMKKIVENSARIGSNRVTVHPGLYSPLGSLNPSKAEKRNLEAFKILKEKSENEEVKISIENLTGNFIGKNPEEINNLIKKTNVDFTFDIGHAFITGVLDDFMEKPEKINHLHLHDNNGERDEHFPIGEGKIPLNYFKKILRETNKRPVIEGRNLKEGRKSLKKLNKLF